MEAFLKIQHNFQEEWILNGLKLSVCLSECDEQNLFIINKQSIENINFIDLLTLIHIFYILKFQLNLIHFKIIFNSTGCQFLKSKSDIFIKLFLNILSTTYIQNNDDFNFYKQKPIIFFILVGYTTSCVFTSFPKILSCLFMLGLVKLECPAMLGIGPCRVSRVRANCPC